MKRIAVGGKPKGFGGAGINEVDTESPRSARWASEIVSLADSAQVKPFPIRNS